VKTTAFLLLLAVVLRVQAEPVLLTVSAAISLQVPLEALKADFEKANPGIGILLNFGSSGSLQQQIVNGAPVDIFISAAAKQMDELEKCGMIIPASRFVVVGNTVVLVAPAGSQAIAGFGDLASVRTLAIGEPKSVPAGMYAMEILEHLGLAEALKDKLVFAKDVRQVLVYVETGNADAGIVYASDAADSKAVRVATVAPEGSHQKVEYPAAVVKGAAHGLEAERFLNFLRSREASELFKSAGFVTASGP
jgi:molybdate transport system substrate-binding protein